MSKPLDGIRDSVLGLFKLALWPPPEIQAIESPPEPQVLPSHIGDEIYLGHFSEANMASWPWANFSPREFASKGNGAVRVNIDSANRLQRLRNEWGRPMRINSAYRDPVYNRKVGGAPLSMHLKGRAFDISVVGFTDEERRELVRMAASAGFTGFGGYSSFLHVDNGKPRVWGQKWGHPK